MNTTAWKIWVYVGYFPVLCCLVNGEWLAAFCFYFAWSEGVIFRFLLDKFSDMDVGEIVFYVVAAPLLMPAAISWEP